MILNILLWCVISFSPCIASENLSEDEGTELYYQTLLVKEKSYAEKLTNDYFELNKKRLEEEKELQIQVEKKKKKIKAKNRKIRSLSGSHESTTTKLSEKEEEISSLLKSFESVKDENNYLQGLIEDFKKEFIEKETLIKLVDEQKEKEIEDLKQQLQFIQQKYIAESVALTQLQETISPYKGYQLFFNPNRKQPHKLISNEALTSEKWFLTSNQAHIITHFIDNGVSIQKKNID